MHDSGATSTAFDELFDANDRNGNGHLDLNEVALLMKRLSPEQSLDSARNAAMEALLMADADVNKKLDRGEFEQLVRSVLDIGGVAVDEGVQHLLQLCRQEPQPLDADEAAQLRDMEQSVAQAGALGEPAAAAAAAAAASGPAKGFCTGETAGAEAFAGAGSAPAPGLVAGAAGGAAGSSGAPDAGRQVKLLELFDLWDVDHDGCVDFSEVCQGLATIRPLHSKQDAWTNLSEAARLLATHAPAGCRHLGAPEFGALIADIMGAGCRLDDVADRLIALAGAHPPDARLHRVLEAHGAAIEQLLAET